MCGRIWWSFVLLVVLPAGCASSESSAGIPASGQRAGGESTRGSPGDEAPVSPAHLLDLDADPHLMGWWRFEETTGRTVADSSPHGRDGVARGDGTAETMSVRGRIGRALRFDGSDETFVEIPGYRGVTGTGARTVAAWIRTRDADGEFLSWGAEEGGRMWIFGFIRSGFGVTPRGGYLYSESTVHDGTWHHVAAVVEEADLPNLHDHVVLYKDGVPEQIHGIGLLDLWPIDTGDELDVRIGLELEGELDDVRVYDRALSAAEIEALCHSAPTGRDVSLRLRCLDRRARALTHRRAAGAARREP